MVRTSTNHTTPDGAWIQNSPPEASPGTVDRKLFPGQAPWHEFILKQFLMWGCYRDYSNSIITFQFIHDFDGINLIRTHLVGRILAG
jgi:hypothetical protein